MFPDITKLGSVGGGRHLGASPAFHHSASAHREGEISLPPSTACPLLPHPLLDHDLPVGRGTGLKAKRVHQVPPIPPKTVGRACLSFSAESRLGTGAECTCRPSPGPDSADNPECSAPRTHPDSGTWKAPLGSGWSHALHHDGPEACAPRGVRHMPGLF